MRLHIVSPLLSPVLHADYCLSKNNLAAGDTTSKDCKYFQMVSKVRGLMRASLKGRFFENHAEAFKSLAQLCRTSFSEMYSLNVISRVI